MKKLFSLYYHNHKPSISVFLKYFLILFIFVQIFYRDHIYLAYYANFLYKTRLEHDAILGQRDFFLKPNHLLVFESKCECKKEEKIHLQKPNDKFYTVSLKTNKPTKPIKYQINATEFENSILTCDMYNSLKRGKHLSVISISLFSGVSDAKKIYTILKKISFQAKNLFPNWIIRIYHDSSIEKSLICDIECLKYQNKKTKKYGYLDNVDFCNVERLPYDLLKTWSAEFVHAMSWRWLILADNFVDAFISRDLSMTFTNQEKKGLDDWILSNRLFHIVKSNYAIFEKIDSSYSNFFIFRLFRLWSTDLFK